LATSALALTEIDAFYGDSHVLQKVSLRLGEGRLLGLLGRNGAGKSTCMNVTVGLLAPRKGTVDQVVLPVDHHERVPARF
jgi:branched-chain amino acid transport system ATP-binding protein